MKRIFLIAFLMFQLLTLSATAQIAPNEAMKSSGKSETIVAQKMGQSLGVLIEPSATTRIAPNHNAPEDKSKKLEALVNKQFELINSLYSDLKKYVKGKDGEKYNERYNEVSKLHDEVNASVTQPWSKELVMFLIVSILAFGLLVLIVMAVLFIRGKDGDQILRMCALPLIIVAAIFLVVTGYSNDQISPVMGLLGAIAGYLLGSKRTGDSIPPRSDLPNGKS